MSDKDKISGKFLREAQFTEGEGIEEEFGMEEEGVVEEPAGDFMNPENMDDNSLRKLIINELTRASESKVDDIFGAVKIQLRLPVEMYESYNSVTKKVNYVIENINQLAHEQLVGIAKDLI